MNNRTTRTIIAFLFTLAIIALSGCIRIQPHSHFLPQTTLSGIKLGGGQVSVNNEQAVTSVDCASLCTTIWGIAEVDEPFEIPANDDRIKVGDACRCLSGPGPRILERGAQ